MRSNVLIQDGTLVKIAWPIVTKGCHGKIIPRGLRSLIQQPICSLPFCGIIEVPAKYRKFGPAICSGSISLSEFMHRYNLLYTLSGISKFDSHSTDEIPENGKTKALDILYLSYKRA